MKRFLHVFFLFLLPCLSVAAASAIVEISRVPDGGIKPVVVVDERGVFHMVYFSGDPRAGDAFYVTSKDGGATWSKVVRVNSQPGSVLGVSHARGPRIALGRGGRVHVQWLGSNKAEPAGNPDSAQPPGGHPHPSTPVLYSRSDEGGRTFEPQRKVMLHVAGLDGDGSIAADNSGHVYAVAHAKEPGEQGEAKRGVYVARSEDDGKTFAAERNVLPAPTGVCACCALTASVNGAGRFLILYRQAWQTSERGMNMLSSTDAGKTFQLARLDQWRLAACPMSVSALLPMHAGLLGAWENDGQVFWGTPGGDVRPVPGTGRTRKGPVLAVNARSETLVAWTENTSFAGGGDVLWQVYGKDGQPTDAKGRKSDLPPHGWVAVASRPDGGFLVLY